ncbi:hypothetical protein M9H77_35080 [Catharanthus roseus]|uniref:Uncharacterized protein n=1 Tax=Catharanthus roseus TaxID=4058 RepID=A0ACB9ZRN2_CATRO|nr:hypothetical protein M9H77_35080 [Catharanthus roseus]
MMKYVKHIYCTTHTSIDINNKRFERKRLAFEPSGWDWSHFGRGFEEQVERLEGQEKASKLFSMCSISKDHSREKIGGENGLVLEEELPIANGSPAPTIVYNKKLNRTYLDEFFMAKDGSYEKTRDGLFQACKRKMRICNFSSYAKTFDYIPYDDYGGYEGVNDTCDNYENSPYDYYKWHHDSYNYRSNLW